MSLGEQSFFWQYPEVPLTEEESEYYQVNGQEMCSIFESMFTTGISPEFIVRSADDTPKNYIGSSLAVSAGEGLSVIVSPGSAMIKGHPYLASLPINISLAEGITDILLQMNTTTDKPFISLVSRPRSGGDIEDNVKREALIYELAIATIDVPIGAIAVTPVMIKDHRLNMTLSPINKQPIAGLMQPKPNVGTLGIWEDWNKLDDYIKKSWTDFIKQSIEAWATYISGKNAEWEQIKANVNGEFGSLTSQFNTQITTNQSNFERWFSTIQTMLDGDVAAELAGKVAKLQADKANKADVYTKSEIDTKLTETNKSISAIKSTTYTKSETNLNRTYTLTHSKSGAVHTLAGLPTTNGIYQCQFVATADYAEGDAFTGYTAKPNGEETTLPNKAFISGDIVSMTVDVGGKKLGFKLGGSTYGTLSPQIRNFAAKAGNHQITLSWTNPSDSNFVGLYLVRKQGSMPIKLSDGTKIDVAKATSYTDNEPENGKLYYYRAFPYNSKKQVQTELTGAVVSAMPKKPGFELKNEISPLSENRSSFGSAFSNKHALFAGGYRNSSYSDAVDFFNETLVRGSCSSLYVKLNEPSGTYLKDSYYFFAGGNYDNGNTELNAGRVTFFDSVNLSKSTGENLTGFNPSEGALAANENYVLYGGGNGSGGYGLKSVNAYNKSHVKSSPSDLSQERINFKAICLSGKVIFAGGVIQGNEGVSGRYNTTDLYNENLSKSSLPSLHAYGSVKAAANIDDKYGVFITDVCNSTKEENVATIYTKNLTRLGKRVLNEIGYTHLNAVSSKNKMFILRRNGGYLNEIRIIDENLVCSTPFSDKKLLDLWGNIDALSSYILIPRYNNGQDMPALKTNVIENTY